MRIKRALLWVAVIVLFCTLGPLLASDHGRVYQLRTEGKILSLEDILQLAPLQSGERIIEVEFEEEDGHLVYEIEIIGVDGIVRERLYDARSGRLIKEEWEND